MEVIGEKKCALPRLPRTIKANQIILTNNHEILTCGGITGQYYSDFYQKCLVLKHCAWVLHSTLNKEREYSASVTMPDGVYLFGGFQSPTTSEFLPTGSSTWQNGPSIPYPGLINGCAVKKSDFEIILIGSKKIIQLNTKTNDWTPLGELQEERYYQRCVVIDGKIMVTGGRKPATYEVSSSTEVISLHNPTKSKLIGQLTIGRTSHGMAVAHVNGKPILLAFGGAYRENDEWKYHKSIEHWNPETKTWTISNDLKLNEPKSSFGFLSVPTHLLCP